MEEGVVPAPAQEKQSANELDHIAEDSKENGSNSNIENNKNNVITEDSLNKENNEVITEENKNISENANETTPQENTLEGEDDSKESNNNKMETKKEQSMPKDYDNRMLWIKEILEKGFSYEHEITKKKKRSGRKGRSRNKQILYRK